MSEALFDEVMSISIVAAGRASNDGFRPSREHLGYYIAADRRGLPGSFSELSFDLDKVILRREPDDGRPALPAALMWRLSDGDYDVPVEYSILTLARVRSGDSFEDIYSYQELWENYDKLTGNLERWREHARYYGVKPPPELLPSDPHAGDEARPPATTPGLNGHPSSAIASEVSV